jgi:hypothetical protein
MPTYTSTPPPKVTERGEGGEKWGEQKTSGEKEGYRHVARRRLRIKEGGPFDLK